MRAHIGLFAVVAVLLAAGCAPSAPALPNDANPAAISTQITGDAGPEFLLEVTSFEWPDDGRRAGELLSWIPLNAQSTDRDAATRAGETAQAIASFLADEREKIARAPANPELWQAFAQSLVPYLGSMVGDESGVVGFEPLDGPNSQMRRTTSMFAAMAQRTEANRILTDAASARAHTYEAAFAKAAVAEPLLADRGAAQRDLRQAARLRAVVATAINLADPESVRFTPAHAQTEVAYQVASLTARPDDPHIEPKFFRDGRLMSPEAIAEEDWSMYDAELTVYLAPWKRINEAIRQFGRVYAKIASAH